MSERYKKCGSAGVGAEYTLIATPVTMTGDNGEIIHHTIMQRVEGVEPQEEQQTQVG